MGNSCCFKKTQQTQQTSSERAESKHLESGIGSAKGLQPRSKPGELLLAKKQSEVDEELRVSSIRRAAFIRPRQATDLMMSTAKFRKQSMKEDSSKNSHELKFVPGQLGLFRHGNVICESEKYKIEVCLGTDSGKLFSLKTVTVDSSEQLNEEDLSIQANQDWCLGIVNYVTKRLYNLHNENLVQYFYADFDRDSGSSPPLTQSFASLRSTCSPLF